MRSILVMLILLMPLTLASAADVAPAQEHGRELSKLFIEGKLDPIWAQMTPTMQQALGSIGKLQEFRAQVVAQLGEESKVADEKTTQAQGLDVYVRTSNWSKFSGPVVMSWAFDGAGKVAGFYVRPEQPAPAQ